MGASSASTQAAVGDRGTDQREPMESKDMGMKNSNFPKSADTITGLSFHTGHITARFKPRWHGDKALTPTFTRSFRGVGKLTKC